MPALAFETRLVLAVLTRIRALDGLNTSNVIWVPDFIEPLPTSNGASVQVRNPTIEKSGMAGGSYLQKVTFDVGIFYRTSADPMYKWDKILTEVNDLAHTVRQQCINLGYSELDLYLYEGPEQSTRPLIVGPDGRQVKEVVWAAFQLWGLKAQTLLQYVD